jgi:FkbM family methyltransferase
MLNAHSQICVPHELQILFEESGNGRRLLEVFESNDHTRFVSEDYIRLIEERCPYRIQEYFDLKGFFKGRKYPEKDLQQLSTDLFTAIAQSKGKSYFIEQTPWYGQHIPALNKIFPRAKFIHVIRDGRDVAISFARTPWWSNEVLENLRRWEREATVILRDSSEILTSNQVMLIRYEDLVHCTEKTLRDACVFLGVIFEPSMLDSSIYISYESYQKDKNGKISSEALRRWKRNSNKPTFTGSVQSWKTYKGVDFRNVSDKVTKLLLQLGYEQLTNPPMTPPQGKNSLTDALRDTIRYLMPRSSQPNPSPINNGSHANTDPFFDTLRRLGYVPSHIVDVGANRGNWTRTAMKYFPGIRYTMFEPQEKMRSEVEDLLQKTGVEFHCMGAGPMNSTMKLTQHEWDDSHTFALTSEQADDLGYPQVDVPVVALDDFFKERGLPKIDILKIDAEGWDLEVLKGAAKTATEADIVLMEASVLNPVFQNTVEKVLAAMSLLGFTLLDITDLNRTKKDNALWLVELAFVKQEGSLKKAIQSYI